MNATKSVKLSTAKFHKALFRSRFFLYAMLGVIVFAFIFSNFVWLGQGQYAPGVIFKVLENPTQNQYDGASRVGSISPDDFRKISEGAWAVLATLVASVGLALTGLVTQSLTKNPLADASTLGFMQAGIFMLLVAIGVGWTAYYVKFLFVVIGVIIGAGLLFVIITLSRGTSSAAKVILAGLAIGIIFKTFSFLVRRGDKTLSSVSYNYILGGAESINKSIGESQWLTLYISAGLIVAALLVFYTISRSLTVMELGEDKAKQLGIKVPLIKIIAIFVLVVAVPSAVILVGNLAFIGLFAAHISRYLFKSRNYRQLLLPSIMVGSILGLFGLFMSNWVPQINSGLWMTFMGAPFIIYAGIRGLR